MVEERNILNAFLRGLGINGEGAERVINLLWLPYFKSWKDNCPKRKQWLSPVHREITQGMSPAEAKERIIIDALDIARAVRLIGAPAPGEVMLGGGFDGAVHPFSSRTNTVGPAFTVGDVYRYARKNPFLLGLRANFYRAVASVACADCMNYHFDSAAFHYLGFLSVGEVTTAKRFEEYLELMPTWRFRGYAANGILLVESR